MNEISLDEVKEWIKSDSDAEDINTLPGLISTSKIIIKQSTGVTWDDVQSNEDASNLYKTLQKYIITDLYFNQSGKMSYLIASLYIQLEAYKLPTSDTTQT
jgi:hypothetical protein